MEPTAGEVTELLRAWSAGDRNVEERLFEIVLPDLRRVAQHLLRRERPDHTLQPSALLNEAYLRLINARERDWQNRGHFFAIAARIMRRLLIDHARGRWHGRKVPIDGIIELLRGREVQLEQAVAIDSLLDQLEATQPQWCRIIEMRFFLGLTEEETAGALSISVRTMQRQYADARRWLFERLESSPGASPPPA